MVKHVPLLQGRKLLAETLQGTYDFAVMYAKFNMNMKGITSTHDEPDACHVWRIMSRFLLQAAGFHPAAIKCNHLDWETRLAVSDHDAVLLTKSLMHSGIYSQAPQLLLPEAIANNFSKVSGEGVCK